MDDFDTTALIEDQPIEVRPSILDDFTAWIPTRNHFVTIQECTEEQFRDWCRTIYPALEHSSFSSLSDRQTAFSQIIHSHIYLTIGGQKTFTQNN